MIRRPPRSPLFPSPPLFRSKHRRCGPAPPPEDPGLLCRPSQLHGPGKIEPDPRSLEFVATRSVADRKSTRLNSSHSQISYAVFCLKKKKRNMTYMSLHTVVV